MAVDHMAISNLTKNLFKSVKQSALSNHLLESRCTIYFDYFTVLISEATKVRFCY